MRPADAIPRTVGEVEGFIALLRSACSDAAVNARLQEVLSLPDQRRKALLHTWITDILTSDGPRELAHALACLLDDAVAEKAYEVIYQCGLPAAPGGSLRRWAIAIAVLAAMLFAALSVGLVMQEKRQAPDTRTYRQLVDEAKEFLQQKRPKEGLKLLQAAEQQSRSRETRYYIGWALHDLRRYEQAVAAYSEALEPSGFTMGYWRRGLSQEALGRAELAAQDYEKAARQVLGRTNLSPSARDMLPELREKLTKYGLAEKYPI